MNKVELKAEDIRVNDDKPSGDNLTKEQIQELALPLGLGGLQGSHGGDQQVR